MTRKRALKTASHYEYYARHLDSIGLSGRALVYWSLAAKLRKAAAV